MTIFLMFSSFSRNLLTLSRVDKEKTPALHIPNVKPISAMRVMISPATEPGADRR